MRYALRKQAKIASVYSEDYPILKVNDLSDDNAMLEFAVIGLECDILKLSFLGRIKG